jgi:PTH1 family peptidyl-tRNA hydrolase
MISVSGCGSFFSGVVVGGVGEVSVEVTMSVVGGCGEVLIDGEQGDANWLVTVVYENLRARTNFRRCCTKSCTIVVMYYIVGLGNPGETYEATRHNVGWMVLDNFIATSGLPTPVISSKYVGRLSEGVVNGCEVRCVYPETYMNKSGSAVAKLVPREATHQLVVLYDDVDLPLGEVKVSFGRGDGGHNGIKSIVNSIGTKDFVRVRIGICPTSFWTRAPKRPQGAKLPKYVLGKFTTRERQVVQEVSQRVHEILLTILTDGYPAAMNQWN